MHRTLSLLILLAGPAGADWEEALPLRQEYNQVVAAIDTLVRLRQGAELERLTEARPPEDLVPAGMEVVLLFWADDEAEVWLNGLRVGQTRLTPTRARIPSLYLSDRNVLQIHAWDTDRVESGAMAGLYLEDAQQQLRPVLITREQGWRTSEGPARELYYVHAQPEIPGARVIWGTRLFGEVWLEGEFAGSALRQAATSSPLAAPAGALHDSEMAAHQTLARLVELQSRRQDLARRLGAYRRADEYPRWPGHRGLGLALSLGRAAPLDERQVAQTATHLHQWVLSLPPAQQALLLPEARLLKGTPTPAQAQAGSQEGRADRRAQYQPPPERGRGPELPQVRPGGGFPGGRAGRSEEWSLWLLSAGLAAYVAGAGLRWWRLFNETDWETNWETDWEPDWGVSR